MVKSSHSNHIGLLIHCRTAVEGNKRQVLSGVADSTSTRNLGIG